MFFTNFCLVTKAVAEFQIQNSFIFFIDNSLFHHKQYISFKFLTVSSVNRVIDLECRKATSMDRITKFYFLTFDPDPFFFQTGIDWNMYLSDSNVCLYNDVFREFCVERDFIRLEQLCFVLWKRLTPQINMKWLQLLTDIKGFTKINENTPF